MEVTHIMSLKNGHLFQPTRKQKQLEKVRFRKTFNLNNKIILTNLVKQTQFLARQRFGKIVLVLFSNEHKIER